MQTIEHEVEQNQETQVEEPKRVPFAAVSRVKHIQADNVYVKSTFVPKNVKFYTKRTNDSHVAILAFGELVVEDGDQRSRLLAPANYVIPANSRIAIYTLTDCVFYCVHATPETDLEVLDKMY